MSLHANSEIAPGHVVVLQKGDKVLVCRLEDLIYEPDDEDTDMIVNPVDVAAASSMWFEPKGQLQ
ncbi:hypothetical protein [Bradyrhizobium betae]|uniref:hypothetical protein n=1 Tax=Bradyrhizobium betae TaxID=244734 RepID=UPI0013875B7A|nr:hypothetical protein [Bradyrhizobium betae]MCS3727287.1 3'-phosphoadenosine 5'-phosphosulfate (PAPS) 3'-phosphatase [Bradyrhizobium betae]